jgi:hypothetical protein
MAGTDEAGAVASDGILTNSRYWANIAIVKGKYSHNLWHFER